MSNEDLIKQFQELTNSNEQEAKFYLESHNWDSEEAITSFYETNLVNQSSQQPTQQQPPQPTHQPTHQQPQPTPTSIYSKSVSNTKKPATNTNRGGIKTLSDFSNDDHDDHDHDDESDDESQNYYAGGKNSGLLVQSAPKAKKDPTSKDEVVDNVFEGAKSQGAVPASEKKVERGPNYTAYDGKAFQLGNDNQQSKMIENKVIKPEPEKEVKIVFWSQGFTVDDGPLRPFNDPKNKDFLEAIQKGIVPPELESKYGGNNGLPIVLVDNRNKEWTEPPKPKYVAFSGGGQALGNTNNNNNNNNNTTTTTSTTSKPTVPTPVTPIVKVDNSQPTTTIQIKLADGTRLQSTFNHTHTLSDVISFINTSSNNSRSFDLLTGFPQKPITTDPNTSLKDAGLLNSLLIQKFK